MKLLQQVLQELYNYMERVTLLEFYANPSKVDLDAKFQQMLEWLKSNEPKTRYEKMSLAEILHDVHRRNVTANMNTITKIEQERGAIDIKFEADVKNLRALLQQEEGGLKQLKLQLEQVPKEMKKVDDQIAQNENELSVLKALEANPKYEAQIKNLKENQRLNEAKKSELVNLENHLRDDYNKHSKIVDDYKRQLSSYTDETKVKMVLEKKNQIQELERINREEEVALEKLKRLFHQTINNPNSFRDHLTVVSTHLKRDDALPSDWLEFLHTHLLNQSPTPSGYFTIPTRWTSPFFSPAEVTPYEMQQTFALLIALKSTLSNPNQFTVNQQTVYVAFPAGLIATIQFFKRFTEIQEPKLYVMKRYDENQQTYDILSADGYKTSIDTIEGLWYCGANTAVEIRLFAAPLLMGVNIPVMAGTQLPTSILRSSENKDSEKE